MTAIPDALIVGAGIAGLACGLRLAACGVPFQILEAEDHAGGRFRTDAVNGFQLDRTFPLCLTAFPEVRRVLDLDQLDLKLFERAALVWFQGKFHRLADPRFEPFAAVKSLANPIGTFRDKLRMIRFTQNLESARRERPPEASDRLALDLLRWNGRFSPAFIDRLFRPLAGLLFLDRSLATPSREFRQAFRAICEGPAAVPALGMQAIPDQIAARLPPSSIRLGAKVERIGHREIILAGGETVRGRAVIVAAPRLLDDPGKTANWRGTALVHYAAEQPPVEDAIVMLDGEGRGPVNHLAVLSNFSAAFAPAGKVLIAAGTVGDPREDDAELDRRVRLQLAEWFGAMAAGWRRLRVSRDPLAMSDQTVEVRRRPGLYVCDNVGLEDALLSGFHAAQAAMEDLHAKLT